MNEPPHRGNALEAVDAHKCVVGALRDRMVLAGIIEIEVPACFAAAQKEFDVCHLLFFRPDVSALEFRTQLKMLFFLRFLDPFDKAVHRVVTGIAAMGDEPGISLNRVILFI